MSARLNHCSVDYRLETPIALHAQFEIRGFTALLGRSGAGKTSLLKALAGLAPARGTPNASLPPEARAIGYLPQNSALFPHLTALENVAYPLRGADRFARASALMEELGLSPLSPLAAPKLSGGQAQRVALARALAGGATLLLLDEPSAALDATTRDATLAWLIKTITTRAIPTLAATHDPAIARLADWIALLADRRIIQQGTPRAVFNEPKTPAAAEILGFENIWDENGATYAIRAADIAITPQGRPATIIAIREYGPDLRLECTMPQPITIHLKAGALTRFAPGDSIHLTFPPGACKRL